MKSANTGKALSFLAYSAQERVYGGQSKCESAFTSSASCLPDGVDSAKAVCILLAYLTAFQLLDLRRSR
jgi:hypothetical protein